MKLPKMRIEELPGVLVIYDLGHDDHPTFTNRVAVTVQALAAQGYDLSGRVIYRDTDGRWDEVVIENQRFKRFAPIGTRSLAAALAKIGIAPAD